MAEEFPFNHFLKKKNLLDTNQVLRATEELPKQKVEDIESISNDEGHLAKEIHLCLKERVNTEKYTAFFENIFQIKKIAENIITFSVTTPFIKTMLETHYNDDILYAIYQSLGKTYDYQIVLAPNNLGLSSNKKSILNSLKAPRPGPGFETSSHSHTKTPNEPTFRLDLEPTSEDLIDGVESKYLDHVMNPRTPGFLIDTKKTFDCFVIGPSNNMAYATTKAVANLPGKQGKYPSLYIYSTSGLGKTHLLNAVANGIRESRPDLVICIITARDFMNEMVDHIQKNNIGDFRRKYSEKIDILMIDDIHELKNKQGTQNEFFHIFNVLHNKGKQLIFTSDKAPHEIDGIEERIKTRLQWGLVIDIQRPDLETRIAILKNKANELDLYLPDDLLGLIAGNIKSSIRVLEGSLIKLSAFADVMNVEIDAQIIKDVLTFQDESDDSTLTLEIVARAVSQYFKIPLADLKSRARNQKITRSRHMAMYLSQKLVTATLFEIGQFYGGRDHTSVMHGINKVKEVLKTDKTFISEMTEIEAFL